MDRSSSLLKQRASALGFNLVGITPAEPSPFLAAYEQWVADGMHGEMGYMARPDRVERRRDLSVILPGVRSLVVVGFDYSAAIPNDLLTDPARGRIAAYAWGLDYHEVMLARLEALATWMQATLGVTRSRAYVDTGPLLERGHGYAAGLGFIGKNTMLIHPRRGSYFFLGEILTGLTFDRYDTAQRATMCGTCTRCLNACPTDAFPQPHVLDARRCISYLTIEHKGWIDPALRPLMGNWVFGCDICQAVCPFQRFSSQHPIASPKYAEPGTQNRNIAPPLLDLLALDQAGFSARFDGTAIARIKRDRMVRNACIAAGNWGDITVLPVLVRLLDDHSALVRGHAAWALGRIPAREAKHALSATLGRETDDQVRQELTNAITS